MGTYTDAGKNKMLGALGATHVAAYSGDPTAGGTELGRAAVAFAAPAGGAREQSGTAPKIAIAAGKTVDHLAYYDAASAGTLLMYDDVPAETFTNAGDYTVTSSAHDLNQ